MRVERESPRSAVSNGQFSAGATNALFAAAVLKLSPSVPLKPRQMANSLSVTFYPPHEESPRLERFVARLKRTFENLGVEIIPFEDALLPPRKERLRPGIVVIEQGEGKTEDLAIHRVSSVNKNPLVARFATARVVVCHAGMGTAPRKCMGKPASRKSSILLSMCWPGI